MNNLVQVQGVRNERKQVNKDEVFRKFIYAAPVAAKPAKIRRKKAA